MSTDLLRTIVTRMTGLQSYLKSTELLERLKGNNAQIGGHDFDQHATPGGRRVPPEFVYTPAVIQQLKDHLMNIADLVDTINDQYGTAPELR